MSAARYACRPHAWRGLDSHAAYKSCRPCQSDTCHVEDILQAIPGCVALALFVLDEGILRSNLQPLVEQGLIRIVSPDSEAEEHAFVNFAAELDDGEASHKPWPEDRGT